MRKSCLEKEKSALENENSTPGTALNRVEKDNTRLKDAYKALLEKDDARAEEYDKLSDENSALEARLRVLEAAKREVEKELRLMTEDCERQVRGCGWVR